MQEPLGRSVNTRAGPWPEASEIRLASRISEASGQGPALVFTDLPSGSCMLAALTIARAKGEVRVVTGVNLAMLLDFVFHRDLPPADAAARAAAAGEKAIRVS